MTAPKIGERHRECHREIMMLNDEVTDEKVLAIMAKHFPEDDSWVERAAEEIQNRLESTYTRKLFTKEIIEIVNGCRR